MPPRPRLALTQGRRDTSNVFAPGDPGYKGRDWISNTIPGQEKHARNEKRIYQEGAREQQERVRRAQRDVREGRGMLKWPAIGTGVMAGTSAITVPLANRQTKQRREQARQWDRVGKANRWNSEVPWTLEDEKGGPIRPGKNGVYDIRRPSGNPQPKGRVNRGLAQLARGRHGNKYLWGSTAAMTAAATPGIIASGRADHAGRELQDAKARAAGRVRRQRQAQLAKSFPYGRLNVKEAARYGATPGTARRAVDMTADERASLRSGLSAVRQQRVERKKPVGPLKQGPNAQKVRRPTAPFANRGRQGRETRRVESAYLENERRDAAPKPAGKKFFIPRTWPISIGSGAAAGAGAGHLRGQERRESGAERGRGAAVGAVVGGGAATTAYHMGGKGAKIAIQRHRERNWDPKRHGKIWDQHKRSFGMKPGANTAEQINAMPFNRRVKFYEQYPKNLPGGRAQRLLAIKNRRSVGVATIGGGALVGAGLGQRRKVEKAAQSHRLKPSYILRQAHPKRLPKTIHRNRHDLAPIAGGLAVAGAADQGVRRAHGRDEKGRQQSQAPLAAGLAGGAGAQAAYMTRGQRIRQKGKAVEHVVPEGMSRSARNKLLSDHRKRTGVKQGQRPTFHQAPKFFGTYPKELPGAEYKHRLARISGRRGQAINAGIVGGAALGSAMAGRAVETGLRRRGKQQVEKAEWGYREKKVDPVNAAQMAAGGAAMAYGVPRLKMTGDVIAYGQRAATVRGYGTRADQVVQGLGRAGQATRAATGRGVNLARRSSHVNNALNAVPKGLRAPLAAGGGALLFMHGRPLREERFVPVPIQGRPVFGAY